jgi:protein TonB
MQQPDTHADTATEVMEARPVEETAPEIAESVPADVVVPIPQARPVQADAETVQPEAETAERVVEEVAKPVQKKDTKVAKKQEEAKKKPAKSSSPAATAAKTDAKPAEKAAAPKKSDGVTAPRVSPAKWQGQVLAWLRRHQRYPTGPKSKRQEGIVKVAFSIDPSGRVLSARVVGSSGNAELDRAAVESVRRSSPVPAPPKEMARQKIALTHSVVFDLK